MDYNYIAVEGNIGAGKTSLVKLLGEELKAKIILERFAENPFLSKFYSDPERYSFPVELSFLADRYYQLKAELSTRNIFSSVLIADYYFSKSLIFASNTLKPDEYNLYRQIYNIIHRHFPLPDLYVYLHVPVDRLLKHIRKRGRDFEQSITEEYLIKLQMKYFEHLKVQKDLKILLIDISNIDFVNNSDDYCKIRDYIIKGEHLTGINRIIL
jgi:deoxyadenosine/deoxycytidine kinase